MSPDKTYAHVECVRKLERNPATGLMMVPKLMAQCSNNECRKYVEMGSLAENQRHDLRCPHCLGFDLKLAWWMCSDTVTPESAPPACGTTTAAAATPMHAEAFGHRDRRQKMEAPCLETGVPCP